MISVGYVNGNLKVSCWLVSLVERQMVEKRHVEIPGVAMEKE